MRYFVITGSTDTYVGLRLAGMEGVIVYSRQEALEAIDRASSDPEVGVLLITEELAMQCQERLAPMKLSGRTPLIVEIPDRHGARQSDSITRYIREAIGVKL